MSACIYDFAWGPLRYPLAILFLIDFHLTWGWHEVELRGGTGTIISYGLAILGGLIGKMWGFLWRR